MWTTALPLRAGRECVLVIAPFGDEMNKCRPMFALQARKLAERGFDVLLVDLHGTGDSAGDFGDASWEQWSDDLRCAWEWLAARHPAAIHVLAARSGALLMDALTQVRTTANSKLVLWQPTIKGADYWRQVLRLRLAAQSIRGGDAQQPSSQELLEREGGIEIAGYRFSANLVRALSDAVLSAESIASFHATLWAEISVAGEATLSPVGQRTILQWQAAGAKVSAHVLSGEPFWTTPEIALVPALIDATCDFFGSH